MSSSPTSSSSSEPAGERDPFADLHDVICSESAQLGTATLTVGEALALRRHSIIRLRQSAGEDLLVTVNGHPIAQAEVIIVDNTASLRLTQIVGASGEGA